MSLSASVCLSEVILLSFNRVLSGFQGRLKEVQWVFEESFKGVLRMLQGSVKGVSRRTEGCF